MKKRLDITSYVCYIGNIIKKEREKSMSKFTDFVEKMAQDPKNQVSEVKVMKSNAGYYAGRTCFDAEMRCFVPFDRQSAYYLTSEEVKALIKEKKNLQRIMKNMRKVVA